MIEENCGVDDETDEDDSKDDPNEVEYWIDVDGQKDADDLLKLLKRYKMRKKVHIDDLSHIIKSF